MIKNVLKILTVVGVLALFAFAPTVYRLIPFGSGTVSDTAYAKGSLRVDGGVRLVSFATSDSTKALTFNSNGVAVLRSVSGLGGQNLSNAALSANGDYTHDWGGYSTVIQNINGWAMDDTDANRLLAFNSASTGMLSADGPANTFTARTVTGSVGVSGSFTGGVKTLTAANGVGNSLIFKSTSGYDSLNLKLGGLLYMVADTVTKRFAVSHLGGIVALTAGTVGTGAGTGASYSISGTDVGGYISVTTGTGCATDATVITLTYGRSFSNSPYVTLIPANKATVNLAKGQEAFVDNASINTTTFAISSNGTALADATVYTWRYIIVQ